MNNLLANIEVITRAMPFLLNGLVFTVSLAVAATLGGLVLSIPLAMMRLSRFPLLSSVAYGYITLLRSIPLLLVLFWFYFLMPLIMQRLTGSRFPVPIGPVFSAVITFIVFETAFYAEIIRAGIMSVDKGQIEASQALRLNVVDRYRFIILPQAIKRMLPILLGQTIILFQDTSLVYVLTLPDFLGVASRLGQREGQLTFFYLFVAGVFFLICFSLSQLVRRLELRNKVAR